MAQSESSYYRTIGDADAYFASQLYATDWTGASAADKAKALLMATRAVDSLKFRGVKRSVYEALVADGGDTTLTGEKMLALTELTELELITADRLQVHQFPRGNNVTAESWKITIDAANGTYTITFDGQTTAALNHDATAATIQAALEALSSVGAGNITVAVTNQDDGNEGTDGEGPYLITVAGDLLTAYNNTLSVTNVDLVGGSGITSITINDNVPDPIFYAVCEEAKSLLSGRDAEQEFRNLELNSDGVGSNRVTMDRSGMPPRHTAHLVTSPLAWKYLQRYLAPNNSFTIKRT